MRYCHCQHYWLLSCHGNQQWCHCLWISWCHCKCKSVSCYQEENPDILSFDKATHNTNNLQDWRDDAFKKIKQLGENDCWQECPKIEAKEKGETQIPPTCIFYYRHNPTGDITKCKTCTCLSGDLIEDDGRILYSCCDLVNSPLLSYYSDQNESGDHICWLNKCFHLSGTQPTYVHGISTWNWW